MSYLKFKFGELTHFIRSDVVGKIDFGSSHNVMCSSDIVVNTRENTIVKCRSSIVDIISYGILDTAPQPIMVEQCPVKTGKAEAWMDIVHVLTEVMPNWTTMGDTGASAAVNAIRQLKKDAH